MTLGILTPGWFVNLYFEVEANPSKKMANKKKWTHMSQSSAVRQFSFDETMPQRKLHTSTIQKCNGPYTKGPDL